MDPLFNSKDTSLGARMPRLGENVIHGAQISDSSGFGMNCQLAKTTPVFDIFIVLVIGTYINHTVNEIML